jgi:hypothetical protein
VARAELIQPGTQRIQLSTRRGSVHRHPNPRVITGQPPDFLPQTVNLSRRRGSIHSDTHSTERAVDLFGEDLADFLTDPVRLRDQRIGQLPAEVSRVRHDLDANTSNDCSHD